MVRIELGDWGSMRRWAEPIRFEVFVEEQKVPRELELDDWDVQCVHAVAFDEEGSAVGTGRLLPDGHIGRMAVLERARGSGTGSELLTCLMAEAKRRGLAEAVLSAQTHAVPFYERHGYSPSGAEYLDAGIPHIDMRRPL
ncbi:MAG: GNAT family N-acetyltransferase [Burkholderiaceae bacterium]